MSFNIGYSIFPSTWKENKHNLEKLFSDGSAIFTSLHISEEFNDTYAENVMEMLTHCKQIGYQIIADISPRTLPIFGCNSISDLHQKLPIDIARVDYGFSLEDVLDASKNVPICLNASTLTTKWLQKIKETHRKFYAMHNYYPRPETGLDAAQFDKRNQILTTNNIEIMAFIPGNLKKRGPIYEGLLTLESHRHLSPYAAFVEMVLKHNISWVFVGDGMISENEMKLIERITKSNIYTIPTIFEKQFAHEYSALFSKDYSIRPDSPANLIRFQESREYATQGMQIKPSNCIARPKGTLTIDNELYGRYSGEIQLTRSGFNADQRVNVIGHVPSDYFSVLDALPNGAKFRITSF